MFAVTTRNKLNSPRFLVSMLAARRHVRCQLRATPGLLRWADAIGSPTEFYTLTLWESRQAVFDFMSSDAHRDMMWMFSRWSDEFWSMRWLPTGREAGAWDDLHVAEHATKSLRPPPQTPVPHLTRPARAGFGSLDPTHAAVMAVTARVRVRSPQTALQLLRLTRDWRRQSPDARPIRWAIGSMEPNEYVVLTVWPRSAADSATISPWHTLTRTLPDAWVMEWQPGDYEIGHWDGLRLRHVSTRRVG